MVSEVSQRRTSRPFSTLRKESSADDEPELHRERSGRLVPLTRSPFKPKSEPEHKPEPEIKHHPNELVVYVSELPWSDLLLEIAMTTAFASLTDGTPILDGPSVASYLVFFAMVWWVWASQVAYNVRFRQSDWLHRLFAFLQLVIFCALAAFTNNFDVTNGITSDAEQKKIEDMQMADFETPETIAVANFRNNRLPTLNARGISLTMGFSRLLLLVQYLLAFYHSTRENFAREKKRPFRRSFFVHIGTLVLSSLCYFIAYCIIGKSPDKGDQIAKLFLWYVPLLVEVASHFVAASLPGRVRYPAKEIYTRSATVFIIILGGGLDKITNGFQYIVGNVSLGFESLGLILCAVLIVTLQFSLYFGSSEGDVLGSRRAIAVFFFSFFYLSAVIVTLQGIAAMLVAGNIGSALEVPFRFVSDSKSLLESKGFGVNLTAADYNYDQLRQVNKTGVALDPLLEFINSGITWAVNESDFNLPFNYLLQADVVIIATILQNFNTFPEGGTLLNAQLFAFFDNDMNNYTIVNNVTFNDLAEAIITHNSNPVRWFYAAGGSVLVMLALMGLINRWPRDKYEWGQTISRLMMGSLIILGSILNINASRDVLDPEFNYQGSRIWFLATHNLVLPPYAAALLVEEIIELTLLYMAGRSYSNFSFSVFWKKKPQTIPYGPAYTSDYSYSYGDGSNSGRMYDEPYRQRGLVYDPYDPYEKTERIPLTQPVSMIVEFPAAGATAPTFGSQSRLPTQAQGGVHSSDITRIMHWRGPSDSSAQPLVPR